MELIRKSMLSPQIPFRRVLHGTKSQAGRKIVRQGRFNTDEVFTTPSDQVANNYARGTFRAAGGAGKPTVVEGYAVGPPSLSHAGGQELVYPGARVFPVKRRPPTAAGRPQAVRGGSERLKAKARPSSDEDLFKSYVGPVPGASLRDLGNVIRLRDQRVNQRAAKEAKKYFARKKSVAKSFGMSASSGKKAARAARRKALEHRKDNPHRWGPELGGHRYSFEDPPTVEAAKVARLHQRSDALQVKQLASQGALKSPERYMWRMPLKKSWPAGKVSRLANAKRVHSNPVFARNRYVEDRLAAVVEGKAAGPEGAGGRFLPSEGQIARERSRKWLAQTKPNRKRKFKVVGPREKRTLP